MSRTVVTKTTREGLKYLFGGQYNRTEAFLVHGAVVRPLRNTQFAVLNHLGEPVCSMWAKETMKNFGLCNFRGAGRDCGDDIDVGMLCRIVFQDGYRTDGTMRTTHAKPLPTYWKAIDRRAPQRSDAKHMYDWLMQRTNIPVLEIQQ